MGGGVWTDATRDLHVAILPHNAGHILALTDPIVI